MGLLEDVAFRLSTQDQAVGSTSSTGAWRIVYREFLPGIMGSSSQDQQIVIRPTGGLTPDPFDSSVLRPTIQLLVRGQSTGDSELEDKLDDVRDALHDYVGSINGRGYIIQMQTDALYLGLDDNQRPAYSLNFQVWRARTT